MKRVVCRKIIALLFGAGVRCALSGSAFAQLHLDPLDHGSLITGHHQLTTAIATFTPQINNDENEYQLNWGLSAIHADAAYKIGITGQGVKIGILDTGVALAHPEFVNLHHIGLEVVVPGFLHILFPEKDASNISAISRGDSFLGGGHGTGVGGVIAAAKDGKGMHGVAYNSQLISANNDLGALLTDEQGDALTELYNRLEQQLGAEDADKELKRRGVKAQQITQPPVFSALKDSGVRVINHSWGNAIKEAALHAITEVSAILAKDATYQVAIATAHQGVLQVWGAGNKGAPYPYMPALMPYFIPSVEDYWVAVVSINEQNNIVDRHNKCGVAAAWCLAAPGEAIYSPTVVVSNGRSSPTYRYRSEDGTSFAAPHVTGAIALAIERFPYMDNKHIREVILTTANNSGHLSNTALYGQGLLDVAKAMRGPGKFRRDFFVDMPLDPCAALEDKTCNDWRNDISGPGGLTKAGPGPLILSGNNTYTGVTYAQAGQLTLNGQLRSSTLMIDTQAMLRGTGTISSPTRVAGILAPGNSVGTLTFGAPLTLLSQSHTQLDIDGLGIGTGAGNYSRVQVMGVGHALTLDGTLVPRLRGIAGDARNIFVPSEQMRFAGVLSAEGSFVGGFAKLTQPEGLMPGTRFDLLFNGSQADLTVSANPFPGIPPGDNATAGAHVLNALRDTSIALRPGAYNQWLGQALQGSGDALAYRTVGGQIHADTVQWSLQYQDFLGQILFDRMAGYIVGKHAQVPMRLNNADEKKVVPRSEMIQSAMSVVDPAQSESGLASTMPVHSKDTLWIYAPYGRQTDTAPAYRLDTDTRFGGLLLGIDRAWGNTRLGAAVGVVDGRITQTTGHASVDISGYSFSGYGRYRFAEHEDEGMYVLGCLSYTALNAKTQRTLAIFGTTLKSQSRLHYGTLELGIGTDFLLREWRFNPELSMRFTHGKRFGFNEQGTPSDDFALALDSHAAIYPRVTAQIRIARTFEVDNGLFTPQIIMGVQQAFHGALNSEGHLSSLVGQTITQKAAADNSTLMRVGIGLNWQSAFWTTRVGAHLHASSFTRPLAGNTKGWDIFWGLFGQW